MIEVIRIRGLIGMKKDQEATMDSLMLRRKYNCILLDENESYRLNKVKELVSFGEIDEDTLKLLISKRAKKGKKLVSNADEILKGLKSGKRLRELGVKPYLGLHPPRGGFKESTRLPYPDGILGKNKEIKELIRKMI